MIFGLFKKKKTNKDINTDIDTDWLKELYELLGEKNAKSVSDFYNVIFFQLKTNVFTLLAPVNLNDEEKLKKFYRHKFSLGYVYGLIIAFLQVADFMRENEKVLHEMLTVAMMKQLFNFKEKTARDFFNKAQTTFRKDQVFMRGIAAGANDWTLFYKENCKGMMGQHFDQAGFNIMKKDLE